MSVIGNKIFYAFMIWVVRESQATGNRAAIAPAEAICPSSGEESISNDIHRSVTNDGWKSGGRPHCVDEEQRYFHVDNQAEGAVVYSADLEGPLG